MFSYLGLQQLNKPFRGWKLNHFEGGYRVPTAAMWPKHIQPGAVYKKAISHMDVLPTVSAAAGINISSLRSIDGVDWMPFVTNKVGRIRLLTFYFFCDHFCYGFKNIYIRPQLALFHIKHYFGEKATISLFKARVGRQSDLVIRIATGYLI